MQRLNKVNQILRSERQTNGQHHSISLNCFAIWPKIYTIRETKKIGNMPILTHLQHATILSKKLPPVQMANTVSVLWMFDVCHHHVFPILLF